MEQDKTELQLQSFFKENLGDYITPKHALLQDCKFEQAKTIVIQHLKIIPDWTNRKGDLEFILRAANFIEALLKKKDKIDKKQLFREVFKELFRISDEELEPLFKFVDFLLNRKLIKAIPLHKKIKKPLLGFVNSFFSI